MAFVENYLSKVGVQTGNAMKASLFELLVRRYKGTHDPEFSEKLAASVVNSLFCETSDNDELRAFAKENEALVKSKAKELAVDEPLCRALTCAIYNFCYGKYVDSGRKVGLVSHPFLGYVRALQQVIEGKEPASFLETFESKVGENNVLPLLNLWFLGLARPLPPNPDSKRMMDEVASFCRTI